MTRTSKRRIQRVLKLKAKVYTTGTDLTIGDDYIRLESQGNLVNDKLHLQGWGKAVPALSQGIMQRGDLLLPKGKFCRLQPRRQCAARPKLQFLSPKWFSWHLSVSADLNIQLDWAWPSPWGTGHILGSSEHVTILLSDLWRMQKRMQGLLPEKPICIYNAVLNLKWWMRQQADPHLVQGNCFLTDKHTPLSSCAAAAIP